MSVSAFCSISDWIWLCSEIFIYIKWTSKVSKSLPRDLKIYYQNIQVILPISFILKLTTQYLLVTACSFSSQSQNIKLSLLYWYCIAARVILSCRKPCRLKCFLFTGSCIGKFLLGKWSTPMLSIFQSCTFRDLFIFCKS